MRGATVVFLLLVSSALLIDTADAGWWSKVKQAVSNAWDWVKKNVNVSVSYNGRFRRDVNGSGDDPLMKQLDSKCANFNVGADAKFSEVIEDVFNVVDEDRDGELSETEVKAFFQLTELLDYCLAVEQAKKKAAQSTPLRR